MEESIQKWRMRGDHLPPFLRDFHDQKDVFGVIHEYLSPRNPIIGDISCVAGHCYVIDVFLWFIARHGYTLQKSRANLEFDDLENTVAESRKRRNKEFGKALRKMEKMANEE